MLKYKIKTFEQSGPALKAFLVGCTIHCFARRVRSKWTLDSIFNQNIHLKALLQKKIFGEQQYRIWIHQSNAANIQ